MAPPWSGGSFLENWGLARACAWIPSDNVQLLSRHWTSCQLITTLMTELAVHPPASCGPGGRSALGRELVRVLLRGQGWHRDTATPSLSPAASAHNRPGQLLPAFTPDSPDPEATGVTVGLGHQGILLGTTPNPARHRARWASHVTPRSFGFLNSNDGAVGRVQGGSGQGLASGGQDGHEAGCSLGAWLTHHGTAVGRGAHPEHLSPTASPWPAGTPPAQRCLPALVADPTLSSSRVPGSGPQVSSGAKPLRQVGSPSPPTTSPLLPHQSQRGPPSPEQAAGSRVCMCACMHAMWDGR